MWQSELLRRQAHSSGGGFGDFIRSLELRVDVAPLDRADLARVLQLTQKTNQFNFTTLRLDSLPAEFDVETTRVSDRYGDYGLVGATMSRAAGSDTLVLENLLMSCRSLGRGVEAQMLASIGKRALARGLSRVEIR